ncbi:RpoL/Rpb11 RNA polymerase subunit family protein, partial [Salmonella enterica]|uniref:RpoL/Rpb11 RNA polymerase subunit family protein n=1 Tax=Salmonella enterica TaxID=28901 RepID=UPI0020C23AA3
SQVCTRHPRPLVCRRRADLPGMSNTSDFILKKEDHTLGNLISEHLKQHKNVLMAGYKSAFYPSTAPRPAC